MGTERRNVRAPLAAGLALVAAATLTACGGTNTLNDGPTNTSKTSGVVHPVALAERPSMETMLKRYDTMQKAVIKAITEKFGDLGWHPLAGDSDMGAGCKDKPDDPNYSTMGLQSWESDRKPSKGSSEEFKQLVEKVLKEHGFTAFQVMNEGPTYVEFFAYDQYDTRFDIGYDKRLTFGTNTGCFKWANQADKESAQ